MSFHRFFFLPRSMLGGVLGLCLCAPVHSQTRLGSWTGSRLQDRLGSAVAPAGDVDGDGTPDIILGAPSEGFQAAANPGYALVISGRTGKELFRLKGSKAYDHFGQAVSGVGDLNGDGHDDFAIGIPRLFLGSKLGSVQVFSGKTGLPILTLLPNPIQSGDHFGTVVSGLGDVNRDGTPDIAVGAPMAGTVTRQEGAVWVFSGKDGKVLLVFKGGQAFDGLGTSISGTGDLNGDGYSDLVAGAPQSLSGAAGYVRFYSGKDGSLLRTLSGDANGDHLGMSVAGLPDVDGDKVPDLVAGAPQTGSLPIGNGGYVEILSGKTGKLISRVAGYMKGDGFGWAVSPAGDVDGDGFPDLAASASVPVLPASAGYVLVLSGRTGRQLAAIPGKSKYQGFGLSLAGVGDLNGDGLPDLLVGSPLQGSPTLEVGAAELVSSWELFLRSDLSKLFFRTGGVQTLDIQAGAEHAGRLYLVLGSFAGIHPGLRIGGHLLPLNYDPYFAFLAGSPNSAVLGSVGLLDGKGGARARFVLPPGLKVPFPSMTLHHAFLVLEPKTLSFPLASNPVVLHLQ